MYLISRNRVSPGLGSTLTLPLLGSPAISSPFGVRAPIAGVTSSPNHPGIDYAVPVGTPVMAAGDGTVTFAGVQPGFGNVVYIDNGNGVTSIYGHLSSFAVSQGQTVSDGQQIALSGATGDVTGPHLHFQVNVNGVAVDPTSYLTDSSSLPDGGNDGSQGFDLSSLGIDFPGALSDLQAAVEAPDVATAVDTVTGNPLLLGGSLLAGAALLYSIFS